MPTPTKGPRLGGGPAHERLLLANLAAALFAVLASCGERATLPVEDPATIGTGEHLKNPSMVKIHQYFDSWYVPNNMAIALAGDIDDPALTGASFRVVPLVVGGREPSPWRTRSSPAFKRP